MSLSRKAYRNARYLQACTHTALQFRQTRLTVEHSGCVEHAVAPLRPPAHPTPDTLLAMTVVDRDGPL